MINQQVMQGSWTELKGQIKERWGQLTDDELTEVQGNAQRLVGLIQRKTGEAKEKVEQELDQLLSSGASLASRTAAAIREATDHATDRVHQSYEHVADTVKAGYDQTQHMVKQRPIESVAAAFGSGLVAGVILGLVMRSR
ncbi:MAG: DUF883 family protein [Planctomycetales bacterium]|nr:DUF883 family protein [Planctomycetales bacterium]